MLHIASLIAGLTALACATALYLLHTRTRPGMLVEFAGANLLALMTGLFPMALAGGLLGLWRTLREGISVSALTSAGMDLATLAATLATVFAMRALVIATYRRHAAPDNVTPLTPRPRSPSRGAQRMKRAA